jgi:hypothetical protein
MSFACILLHPEDALKHDASCRIVIAKIANELEIMIDRDALGNHHHVRLLFACARREFLLDRFRRNSCRCNRMLCVVARGIASIARRSR